ncbi:glutamate--tRNA ligase [Candidatus Woesebacteria bacterium]|nr:glutamate--tRNA ligase [Candidatus Woesebacteria bacterium]
MTKVRTRFAPSPTGFLHIGSLRTALYAYALAKHSFGDFVLRIEDTDQKRKVKGAVDALQNTLKKFGLVWDEFYVQSERQKEGLYLKAAKKLVSDGHAFYCQCEAKNAKEEGYSTILRDPCRSKGLKSGAIKLLVPEEKTLSYFDFVHKKEISWKSENVYDATLLKSDGFPTYHLAVVVDDLEMKISHILRGHDWLPSTPIHLLVFDYLGEGNRPEIGHTTDILSAVTGKKLSKRRDSVFVEQFIENGYLPEALLNFVMLLGWAPKDNRELFTLEEFVKNFDINGFQEANPRFLEEKLNWMNGHYIREIYDINPDSLVELTLKFAPVGAKEEDIKVILPLVKDRMKVLSDFSSLAAGYFEDPTVVPELKSETHQEHLRVANEVLKSLDNWTKEEIDKVLIEDAIKKNNFKVGDFFMSLRLAIFGNSTTPPINDSLVILGKEKSLVRIKQNLNNP